MPTFRVRNLSVTLDAVEKAAAADIDQLCLNQTLHCLKPSILDYTPTLCVFQTHLTCWGLSPCAFQTPLTCWKLSPCPFGSRPPTGCGVNYSTLPPTTLDTLTPVIKTLEDPDILKVLEIQLSDVMKAIRERGIELDKQFRPRSLADAEAVEKELEAALAELKEMKKDLK